MPKLPDIDELQAWPTADLERRVAAATERTEQRINRVQSEDRDMTQREVELSNQDRDELAVLRDALRVKEESATRSKQVGEAIQTMRGQQQVENRRAPSLLVSDTNLHRHAEAMSEGRSFGAIETRATVQVDPAAAASMGSPSAWAQSTVDDPRHIIGFAAIPAHPLTGNSAVAPSFTLPSGAAGVDETTQHGEYDSVVDVPLIANRKGRWTKVSAAVDAFDSLVGLNSAHSVGIARDVDLEAIADIESAAGTPLPFDADVAGRVRLALNQVVAQTYAQVTDLVIVGQPEALSVLQDVQPTSGPDAGSVAARFAGAQLFPTVAASAGVLTVLNPQGFLTFMSPLQSASQIDPADGSHRFGSWIHSTGLAEGIVGSAVAVEAIDVA